MEISIIDIVIFVCCAISLSLYAVSAIRKKMTLKEMFEKRLDKILTTIIILTITSAVTYYFLWAVQRITK